MKILGKFLLLVMVVFVPLEGRCMMEGAAAEEGEYAAGRREYCKLMDQLNDCSDDNWPSEATLKELVAFVCKGVSESNLDKVTEEGVLDCELLFANVIDVEFEDRLRFLSVEDLEKVYTAIFMHMQGKGIKYFATAGLNGNQEMEAISSLLSSYEIESISICAADIPVSTYKKFGEAVQGSKMTHVHIQWTDQDSGDCVNDARAPDMVEFLIRLSSNPISLSVELAKKTVHTWGIPWAGNLAHYGYQLKSLEIVDLMVDAEQSSESAGEMVINNPWSQWEALQLNAFMALDQKNWCSGQDGVGAVTAFAYSDGCARMYAPQQQ